MTKAQMEKRIMELERENAELKKENAELRKEQSLSYAEFEVTFKELYFEAKRTDGLRGPIYSKKLIQKFADKYGVSLTVLNQHYNLLKTNGRIFTVTETKDEMMEWSE